jgi:YHS domain-containing protein
MRAVMVLAWLATLVMALSPWLRPRPAATPPRPAPDELVKDPVCQTYIVRSRAVTVTQAGHPLYFCSTRCAERFALGSA